MKRTFAVFSLVCILLSSQIAVPRNAHALVGGGMVLAGGAGIPLVVAGGVVAGLGVSVGTLYCYDNHDNGLGRVIGCMFVGLPAYAVAAIGLVLMDGESDLAFTELNVEQALALEVTPEQALAFNSELAEINSIRQTIQAEVRARADKGETPTSDEVSTLWREYRPMMSNDAFAALEKVSLRLGARLRALKEKK